ncbi:MAG: elongation factor G, partial [Acidobacteriota bacterium]
MKVYEAQQIRNVALVGHSGAGKTQLVSALLFDAGAVNRFGRVDDGTTVTDYDEEEIARKHTLACSLAWVEWNKHKINLIDTPGMANFLSDARAALRVADAALVVVDAVSGVEVSTEKIWAAAEELELPRIIVLNRLDRERASLERSLESLRAAFGRAVVPIQLPVGDEKQFRGVVDVVAMKAWTYQSDDSGKPAEGPIPEEVQAAATAARETLMEMVAEADDALMERFFDAGSLTQEELVQGLKRGIAAARVFPVLCASAGANIGMQPLLDALISYVPSPIEHPLKGKDVAGSDIPVEAADSGPGTAFIWKTVADPFAGRITMFRVVSGALKADSSVQNVTKDQPERLGHLVLLQGKTQTAVPEIKAGDIGAVAKLKESLTSDVIAEKPVPFTLPAIKFPEPLISYAIEPKSRGDEEKISTALHRLQEEDPTISYTRDAQTKELLIAGQGQLHIEVTVAKLKRRFGVEVNLKLPRIPYRETITSPVEAHGRHKKQTGGHGQFGDCK